MKITTVTLVKTIETSQFTIQTSNPLI